MQRAERLAHEWLAGRAPEVIAPWSIERLRERRMAIHAARPELRATSVTIRRLALQEVFRDAGADDAQSAEIIEGTLDVYMTARNEVELYPEVLACLERLSARYRIASLSNGNACLVQIGLDHLFHAMISAHTHGASKPDPALFHIACRELGCAPEEVVHLGDDIELDIRGARGRGCMRSGSIARVIRGRATTRRLPLRTSRHSSAGSRRADGKIHPADFRMVLRYASPALCSKFFTLPWKY